jgi:hypothetical protein
MSITTQWRNPTGWLGRLLLRAMKITHAGLTGGATKGVVQNFTSSVTGLPPAALPYPEVDVADQRAVGRIHLDLAGGRAARYGGADFGT